MDEGSGKHRAENCSNNYSFINPEPCCHKNVQKFCESHRKDSLVGLRHIDEWFCHRVASIPEPLPNAHLPFSKKMRDLSVTREGSTHMLSTPLADAAMQAFIVKQI